MQLKRTLNQFQADQADEAVPVAPTGSPPDRPPHASPWHGYRHLQAQPLPSDQPGNAKSNELQRLADGIRSVNPAMANVLSHAATLISDTPWLF